jgi:hypothetical protein
MTNLRIARIDTAFSNNLGHRPIVNIEMWDHVPPDTGNFTFRQINYLDVTGAPSDQNLYQYPVSPSCSVDLGSPDQYFDMFGNAVALQSVLQ